MTRKVFIICILRTVEATGEKRKQILFATAAEAITKQFFYRSPALETMGDWTDSNCPIAPARGKPKPEMGVNCSKKKHTTRHTFFHLSSQIWEIIRHAGVARFDLHFFRFDEEIGFLQHPICCSLESNDHEHTYHDNSDASTAVADDGLGPQRLRAACDEFDGLHQDVLPR